MVEDIITGLSRIRGLFVIARNSSFTYKGRAVDVKQVGRELGVRYLLEGSVRKSANRVRIAGQLIDASSGAHLWADRFEGAIEDVFELQDQVTAKVVGAIAAAYAAAASCFSMRKSSGWVIDREQEMAEAKRLARLAVQLGKDDATALCFAGYALAYVGRELDDGAAFLDRTLLINPNLALGWSTGGFAKVWLGEPDRAIERFAHAMRLSPLDPFTYWMQEGMAHAHFFAGRHDEAVIWARMALRELPHSHTALRIAAASCALAGRDGEAKRLTARLLEIDPALRISSLLQNVLGPYRQPEHPAKYANALRKTGLPE